MVVYYGFMFLMVYVSVCTSLFSFPDDNSSKYQWISIKLGICIDIVEIWIGIADQQISSLFLQLSACLYTIVVGYYHFMFYYMFWVIPWHIPHLSFCSFVNMWADLGSITFKIVINYNYFWISWLQITITITFEVNVINYNYNYFTKVIMITLWLLMITFPGWPDLVLEII